jgi:hypothetical protein
MIVFNEIIERLRTLLQHQTGQTKIRDRDIATTLNLDPQYFAVIKRRNKIPYEALAHFCHRQHISLNWILFGQAPRHLT